MIAATPGEGSPSPGVRVRVFWLWMYWLAGVLPVTYAVTWFVDFYLYLLAIAVGAVGFFGTTIARVAYLAIRRRWPCLDRPGAILLGVMVLVHVAALAVLKTVNWC